MIYISNFTVLNFCPTKGHKNLKLSKSQLYRTIFTENLTFELSLEDTRNLVEWKRQRTLQSNGVHVY